MRTHVAEDLADVLRRPQWRAKHQFVGIGGSEGLTPRIGVVDDALLARGLSDHATWNEPIRLTV